MGNLDAMDDFNFTNFQLLLLSQGGFKPLVGEAVVPKFTITHYEPLCATISHYYLPKFFHPTPGRKMEKR